MNTMKKNQTASITLTSYPADRKVAVIKAIREITGLDLKEAKDLVEGVPSVIKWFVSKADAQAIQQRLEDIGAVAEIEVIAPYTESEGDPERIATVFNEVIIPHLREQVYDTLYELAERIPPVAETQP